MKLLALRLLAYTIDWSIIGSFVLVTQLLALLGLFDWNIAHEAMLYLCILAYFVLWEVLNNGQTPGKAITRVRLVCNRQAGLTLYDATLHASILLLTPRLVMAITGLCCFLFDDRLFPFRPGDTYFSSIAAIPIAMLITKGNFGIHDLFSETKVVLAAEEEYREPNWPSKTTTSAALASFVVLTLSISLGFGALKKPLSQFVTGTDGSAREGYPPYYKYEFFSEFDRHMVSLDEITRSMHCGEQFINCDDELGVRWIAGLEITFEDSPRWIADETRQVRFNSSSFFIYRVPVTGKGLLSSEVQALVAQFIRSRIGDECPILIDFQLKRSCAFIEIRVTKRVAVDHLGSVLEPDGASWWFLGARL